MRRRRGNQSARHRKNWPVRGGKTHLITPNLRISLTMTPPSKAIGLQSSPLKCPPPSPRSASTSRIPDPFGVISGGLQPHEQQHSPQIPIPIGASTPLATTLHRYIREPYDILNRTEKPVWGATFCYERKFFSSVFQSQCEKNSHGPTSDWRQFTAWVPTDSPTGQPTDKQTGQPDKGPMERPAMERKTPTDTVPRKLAEANSADAKMEARFPARQIPGSLGL